MDISDITAGTGLIFEGKTDGENLSWNSADLGNFNGKECGSIGFSGHKADSNGLTDNGHMYILHNSKNIDEEFTGQTAYTVDDFAAGNALIIHGLADGDQIIFLINAHDVNGDGLDDIVLSSYNKDLT
jgi:hypothetical protein